jgi:hypothetical protein
MRQLGGVFGIPLTEVGQVDSTKPNIAIKKVKVELHDGCFGMSCLNPWLRTGYPYKCETAVLKRVGKLVSDVVTSLQENH